MGEPTFNPYNFVPISDEAPERKPHRGLDRIPEKGLSGTLVCELEPLTPLFTADHQGARNRTFPFLRDSTDTPILQGTSLKGMVRSVFEALTRSCLCLASPVHKPKKGEKPQYEYAELGPHSNAACDAPENLCPACRLFGTIQSGQDDPSSRDGEVHIQGRLAFSDARLHSGDLKKETIHLAELSSPKPRHAAIYGLHGSQGDPIAGRKLYYHHDPEGNLGVPETEWSDRSHAISEYALPKEARFRFEVRFRDLDDQELGRLLWCLELADDLGHKLGMARPLGFGSCRIRVVDDESRIERGAQRYTRWDQPDPLTVEDWRGRDSKTEVPPRLRDLLRLARHPHSEVGYLDWHGYRGKGIDAEGKFELLDPKKPAKESRAAPGGARLGEALGVDLSQLVPGGPSRPPEKRKKRRFQEGDKVRIEVLSRDGNRFRVRIRDTGDELEHEQMLPWEPGHRQKVKVAKVDAKGRIKEIRL